MQDVQSKAKYMECLDNVTKRLDVLSNMILTLQIGMENEQIQSQAIQVVESIGFCVECIRTRIDEELNQ